ncbi:hypothetical protein [Paenibacillus faecalis]|uniref:hypothetical protein n=1 Tax=Paenibacillus faecalis TaxID=2079532 RepID=UPI00131A5BDC|nr:hypothetical protein [Paenibacillus faecalis]
MTIAIGILIFLVISFLTKEFPGSMFVILILTFTAFAYLGILEYLINEKEGWLLATLTGYGLGIMSRVVDK